MTMNAEHLDGKPHLLFNAAHHGNEPVTVLMALDIIEQLLTSGSISDRLQKEHFVSWIVPVVNPDGLAHFLTASTGRGRKNGNPTHWPEDHVASGVDLNRNYPIRWGRSKRGSSSDKGSPYYRGPRAGSEPETQAMMQLARRYPPVASISYHGGTVAILSPYTIDKLKNPKTDEAWPIAQAMREELPRRIQEKPLRVQRKLYAVDGVDQDWHRYTHGTLAYLLEVSRNTPLHWPDRRALVESWRPAWRFVAERFLNGPSITVKVVDAAGRPVRRTVWIDKMQPRNGEKWSSRCPDGTYHRYLPKAGLYTIRVKDGRKIIRKRVRIKDRNRVVTIRLKRRVNQHCSL